MNASLGTIKVPGSPSLPSGMSAIRQVLLIHFIRKFYHLEKFLNGRSCFPLKIEAIWHIKLENKHSYVYLDKIFVSNQPMNLDKSLPSSGLNFHKRKNEKLEIDVPCREQVYTLQLSKMKITKTYRTLSMPDTCSNHFTCIVIFHMRKLRQSCKMSSQRSQDVQVAVPDFNPNNVTSESMLLTTNY